MNSGAMLNAYPDSLGGSLSEIATPVSYTHLDVYKRQDAQHVMCNRAQDGTCIGGSGMFTTTEDNLRLMKLYLDGGVWEGEQILNGEFVRAATSRQLDTSAAHAHTPWIRDNCAGYGLSLIHI